MDYREIQTRELDALVLGLDADARLSLAREAATMKEQSASLRRYIGQLRENAEEMKNFASRLKERLEAEGPLLSHQLAIEKQTSAELAKMKPTKGSQQVMALKEIKERLQERRGLQDQVNKLRLELFGPEYRLMPP